MIVESFSSLALELYMPTDKVLVGEIAPAMLTKLREDGRAKGHMTWSVLFLALFSWQSTMDDAVARKSFAEIGFVVCIFAAVALPLYLGRRSVWAEVRYRRRHGKWRWDK